ncbi:MAG: type IV pilin protein [Halothiobacillaceae bacterium]|nr:type IV pilin protein [Halothiobacillaceae bacterium]
MQNHNKPGGIVKIAQGFTLIETMVVVAIISLLAAIAYPSYQEFVIKSNRAAAQACLLEQGQFMERFYTANLRYDQTTAGVAVVLPASVAGGPTGCGLDLAARYTFALAPAPTARAYTITATPINPPQKDTRCGVLGITNTGIKTVLGGSTTAADVRYCWK